MTTMVERVATAIAKNTYYGYQDQARAAIEAMRDPTEAVSKAGWLEAEQRDELVVWQAMIDAALKEIT